MAQRASHSFFALLLVGCFPSGEGVDPPADRSVYFPVALALDADAKHLFIVNSDFDLQYNAGTVESWDLDRLRARLPKSCESDDDCAALANKVCDMPRVEGDPLYDADREAHYIRSYWCVDRDDPKACPDSGEQNATNRLLYPGRCAPLDPHATLPDGPPDNPGPIHVDSKRIGAFATDVAFRVPPPEAATDSQGRLFIPVRGDATLHWVDVDPAGFLHCGPSGDAATCDAAHRRGNDPAAENTRGLALLPEPFGVDADHTGRWVMVTNQTSAAVGLFENLWSTGSGFNNGPSYQYTVARLAAEPMGVASVPQALAVAAQQQADLPEFLVGYRGAAEIDLMRVYPDTASDPPRPYAKNPVGQPILTSSNGTDSRGLAVDASLRQAAEAECASRFGVAEECAAGGAGCEDYVSCLRTAAAVPLDVFVANRAPASLLVGHTQQVIAAPSSYDLPAFNQVVPLGFGPSRVVVGDVTNLEGDRERRAFAISFDSHRVVIYDPARQRVEAEIVTGRGPQAMVIDTKNPYGYVAHFTDSYIGVVDLDQRHRTYGAIIANVERPVSPRASK
jgi:hypothetical protein